MVGDEGMKLLGVLSRARSNKTLENDPKLRRTHPRTEMIKELMNAHKAYFSVQDGNVSEEDLKESLEKFLLEAVIAGYTREVKSILKVFKGLGWEVNYRIKDRVSIDCPERVFAPGTPILNIAILLKRKRIAKLMVKHGADVNLADHNGETPLMLALEKGMFDLARYLVEKGADVNARDHVFGWTPLFYALKNIEFVEFLVKHGADINAKDKAGLTVLMYAVDRDDIKLVRKAVELGANPYVKDDRGRSLLFYTCDKKCMELLVSQGLRVNETDDNGWTPLMNMVRYPQNGRILKTVRYLLSVGANPLIRNNDGENAIDLCYDDSVCELVREYAEVWSKLNLPQETVKHLHFRTPKEFDKFIKENLEKIEKKQEKDTNGS